MSNPAQLRLPVELVRFVAAFGVVVAHAQASPRDWVGHLSLGVFLILTAFLAMQSMQRAGGRYKLVPQMRVAQMVIARHEKADLEEVDVLDETVRGTAGYGSTGLHKKDQS